MDKKTRLEALKKIADTDQNDNEDINAAISDPEAYAHQVFMNILKNIKDEVSED